MNKDLNQFKIDEALLSFKKANYKNAINILEKLNEKNSNYIICWYLGHAYFRIYDYITATVYIRKCIKLKEPDELNLNFLAEILFQSNKYEEAIKTFKNVLNINPKNINSLLNLGKIYSQLGRFKDSENYYIKVLQIETNNFSALYELIKINKKKLTKAVIKDVNNHYNQNNFNDIYANFILAEDAKYQKNYKEELNYLIKGHEFYAKLKKKASLQEFNYFTNLLPQFINKVKNIDLNLKDENCPIFIMGLPRSGTTMIENIITSSNNKIINGDETGVMGKVFFSNNIITNYNDNNLNVNFDYKEKDFFDLKKEILKQYKQIGIDISKNLFTDKSLENFLYIDILIKIFPKAKFIYCRRNYIANLLGILKVFLPNLLWCHSLEKIMIFMELYENKLNQILSEKKINLKIIDIESFSADPLNNSKKLFEFLNIKWDEKVLNMNKNNQSIVKTVSNVQVRGKIIKHDLSYLKSYLPFLREYGVNKLT